jgi:HEAT repeat protein
MRTVWKPTLCVIGVLSGLTGCQATIAPDFESPEPAARNAAIVEAAANNDQRAVPALIVLLDSDDPTTRLLAIGTLSRLTGETHGYDYAAGSWERDAATIRWKAWLERSRGPAGEAASPSEQSPNPTEGRTP